MAQLYANEDFPLPVVKGVRRLGYEVCGGSRKKAQAVANEQPAALEKGSG
jgi:hypothetical protein